MKGYFIAAGAGAAIQRIVLMDGVNAASACWCRALASNITGDRTPGTV